MENTRTIEVRDGFEVIRRHRAILGEEVLVGRAEACQLVLASKEVSRKHVSLIPCEDGFRIEDLSRNGVFSSGDRLQSGAVIENGREVEVGPYTLVLDRRRGAADDTQKVARAEILAELVERVDLSAVDKNNASLRPRVEAALRRIATESGISDRNQLTELVSELADEALGLGPIEALLRDETISEIMVVDHQTIFCERSGRIEKTAQTFTSEGAVRNVIDRIITPLGRRIDESSPMVDARLPDGSRVNAVIPPLAIRGACITIRKFPKTTLTVDDLIAFGTLTDEMARVLTKAVGARANVVISGGTGSGKTTLLNVLSRAIPDEERIVTVEDAAELQLTQSHVVSLESRPPNAEGKGQVTIRDLVRNALRMRPDRIVVGECRGAEALDMLQAMNTGHDGSLTTTHANSPAESIARLETLCLMAGLDLPARAIREQIAGAVDVIVQQSRFQDGSRRVTSIAEVTGIEDDGVVKLNEIYRYQGPREGQREGEFLATGWLPRCLDGKIEADDPAGVGQ